MGAGFPKGSTLQKYAEPFGKPLERIILLDKIIKYALAVMAFVEKLAQAVAAFFKERVLPILKPLGKYFAPVGRFLNKIFAPVFAYLKDKPVLTLVIIGIVYFIGIAAVLYPIAGNIYTLAHSRMAITQYDQAVQHMDTTEIDRRFKQAKIYNADLASGIYNDGYERALCSVDDLICFVEVPSVGIYLPVYYGTSEYNLQKGAAWLENTSLPVEGQNVHSVISGHTGLPNAELFTKLDQVKEGEMFYIHVLNKVLAYKVGDIFIVYPNQSSYLDIVPDKDYCTLLTCTPYGINDKRLLVRGERVEYVPPKEGHITSQQNAKSSVNDVDEELEGQIAHERNIIIGIAIVAAIVYVFACIWLMKAVRKPTEIDLTEDEDTGDEDGEDEEE